MNMRILGMGPIQRSIDPIQRGFRTCSQSLPEEPEAEGGRSEFQQRYGHMSQETQLELAKLDAIYER